MCREDYTIKIEYLADLLVAFYEGDHPHDLDRFIAIMDDYGKLNEEKHIRNSTLFDKTAVPPHVLRERGEL